MNEQNNRPGQRTWRKWNRCDRTAADGVIKVIWECSDGGAAAAAETRPEKVNDKEKKNQIKTVKPFSGFWVMVSRRKTISSITNNNLLGRYSITAVNDCDTTRYIIKYIFFHYNIFCILSRSFRNKLQSAFGVHCSSRDGIRWRVVVGRTTGGRHWQTDNRVGPNVDEVWVRMRVYCNYYWYLVFGTYSIHYLLLQLPYNN